MNANQNLSDYHVTCPIENVQWDEHGRPYEQTADGKFYLSKKTAYAYEVAN